MNSITLESVLDLLEQVTGTDSEKVGDGVAEIQRFDEGRIFSGGETRVLGAIVAWVLASVGHSDRILRVDVEVAAVGLTHERSAWPQVIALVASESGQEMVEAPRELLDRLAEMGLSDEELRESNAFGFFTAPHWVGVVNGLVRRVDLPNPESQSVLSAVGRRRRVMRQRDMWSSGLWTALRGRALARSTVLWLLDRDLVDPVSGEVVATLLRWSLQFDPHATDVLEVRATLAALVTRGLAGPDIVAG